MPFQFLRADALPEHFWRGIDIAIATMAISSVGIIVVMTCFFSHLPRPRALLVWLVSHLLLVLAILIFFVPPISGRNFYGLARILFLCASIANWTGCRLFFMDWPRAVLTPLLVSMMMTLLSAGFNWLCAEVSINLFNVMMAFVTLCVMHDIRPGLRTLRIPVRLMMAAALVLFAHYVFQFIVESGAISFRDIDQYGYFSWLLIFFPIFAHYMFGMGVLMMCLHHITLKHKRAASEDVLTGTLSRRAIAEIGHLELRTAFRQGHPLTVAFVDIDNFKAFNDRYGHHAGDQVIRDTSTRLISSCRKMDSVGRYGGEEFCMIFPGAGEVEAAMLAKRILETMREYHFQDTQPVTVSIGLCICYSVQHISCWTELLAVADQELYKAKGAGRNQYSLAVCTP